MTAPQRIRSNDVLSGSLTGGVHGLPPVDVDFGSVSLLCVTERPHAHIVLGEFDGDDVENVPRDSAEIVGMHRDAEISVWENKGHDYNADVVGEGAYLRLYSAPTDELARETATTVLDSIEGERPSVFDDAPRDRVAGYLDAGFWAQFWLPAIDPDV